MADRSATHEHRLLRVLLDGLARLDPQSQERLMRTAAAYCNLVVSRSQSGAERALAVIESGSRAREPVFGQRETLSPKEFLLDKSPQTDVDRVACLAYDLPHYRGQSHFKTIDITKLNTEAAQLRFSNAADAVDNASRRGFLAPAGRGQKQISALGERYVDALPDRNTAREVIDRLRPRRLRRSI